MSSRETESIWSPSGRAGVTRGYSLGPECACRELGTGALSPGTECVAPAPAPYSQEVQFSPVHIEPPHLSRPLQVHGTQRQMCPCRGRALWCSYAQRARPAQVYRHGAPDWRASSGSGKGSGRSGDNWAPWGGGSAPGPNRAGSTETASPTRLLLLPAEAASR